ncbi:hypothetical protein [Williamsia sterculiae]|uniref:Uncharacterized protein n=1 Tax=Williamsia sterculiae TaxID=1344003 RepID=A0A1N7GGW7_9NOCA|nr:hypothetical protein [Williamsia sterculiae]SIS11833.1 hypothetical protein SAMN05445060_2771 [Williamsia sterculiae]
MKAYKLKMASDPDAGSEIVFATTSREAKKQARGQDFYEMSGDWCDLRVGRAPHYDGMEALSERELRKENWRDGWWFHQYGCPDVDEATDEDFYAWYDSNFGVTT